MKMKKNKRSVKYQLQRLDKLKMYATQKGINEMLDTIVNLEELFIKDAYNQATSKKGMVHLFQLMELNEGIKLTKVADVLWKSPESFHTNTTFTLQQEYSLHTDVTVFIT